MTLVAAPLTACRIRAACPALRCIVAGGDAQLHSKGIAQLCGILTSWVEGGRDQDLHVSNVLFKLCRSGHAVVMGLLLSCRELILQQRLQVKFSKHACI